MKRLSPLWGCWGYRSINTTNTNQGRPCFPQAVDRDQGHPLYPRGSTGFAHWDPYQRNFTRRGRTCTLRKYHQMSPYKIAYQNVYASEATFITVNLRLVSHTLSIATPTTSTTSPTITTRIPILIPAHPVSISAGSVYYALPPSRVQGVGCFPFDHGHHKLECDWKMQLFTGGFVGRLTCSTDSWVISIPRSNDQTQLPVRLMDKIIHNLETDWTRNREPLADPLARSSPSVNSPESLSGIICT